MNLRTILAIFRRNFGSYFSSPIGYVFICAFVLLSAFAAFWPNEFFNNNLANLDQLNRALPWIMLVIIPAITMGIWADERRQGTDELLLTLPVGDLDVVAGKYLAAVGIYTVALLFSLFNVIVLIGLGDPDLGLIAGNYFGYWVVGLGMLAVGMAASFLTSNLTVSFILAAAFNAPLAFAAYADAAFGRDAALLIKSLSIAEQFRDFGRGVITLRSLVFFVSLAAVMLYLGMVLIARRHWSGRRAGLPMTTHYALRVVALGAAAIGLNAVAARAALRVDVSSERLSSLSPQTDAILAGLNPKQPVLIEAYISPEVPEGYVQTRLNLLAMLREVDAAGGDRIIVRIHPTERYSAEASEAEQQFGITPQPVQAQQAGAYTMNEIFLGVAVMSGLDKVVIPFFDRGTPVEYELVRSIATVSQQQRRRIGVVATDAQLFGGFDMQRFAQRPDQPIVTELRKQYDVVPVNASQPINDRFDALLVVQPSSLPEDALTNVIAAIRAGQPTAIFEDPFPFLDPAVAPTSQPRVPPGGNNPFMRQQQPPPEPKGEVHSLWTLLQVHAPPKLIIWQDYNPYPKMTGFPEEFVFVDRGSRAAEPFNTSSPITDALQQVLMLFPGSIQPASGTTLQFTPLVQTSAATGVVNFDEMIQRTIFGGGNLNPSRKHVPTGQAYTLAAHITGTPAAPAADEAADHGPPATPINVVLVSDIDCLYSVFFALRERGSDPEAPIDMQFDNVTFVLNILDQLAGDDRFIAIRGRRPVHRTLTAVQERTEEARATANERRQEFMKQFEDKQAEEQARLQKRIDELQNTPGADAMQLLQQVAIAQEDGQKNLQAAVEKFQRERDRELEKIETNLALEVSRVQRAYKLAAIALPPILPLALAIGVYVRRRSLEHLGVPRQRLVE